MRSIACWHNGVSDPNSHDGSVDSIVLESTPVNCGMLLRPDPEFDRMAKKNAHHVAVKVKAFSCNYRDKGLLCRALGKRRRQSFYVVGSDFAGEVVDMGTEVEGLTTGDKVIGNNDYLGPKTDMSSWASGIPTNHASKEYLILHRDKLMKVPETMPIVEAGGFSICAQTAYCMVRKLHLVCGSDVLVTAARSNASLFVINALRKHNVNIYAATTSMQWEGRLSELGVKKVICVAPNAEGGAGYQRLRDVAREIGGFNAVVDCFFDVYFENVIGLLTSGGSYITCGLRDNYDLEGKKIALNPRCDLRNVLAYALVHNLRILGSCLGSTRDLADALVDYASGTFDIVIDSVFREGQVGTFFDRSFNSNDRFGKVMLEYD